MAPPRQAGSFVAGAVAALALAGGGVALAQSDSGTDPEVTPGEQSTQEQTERDDCPRPDGRAPSPDREPDGETG